ncbi:MAG: glucoamylase family protein [Fervidobacterium sp.]|uniref:glucoamylase family protein n=1 Tax=Fervidobacterium sp. TaxID=1871331 RepID=UPI00404972FA
MKPNEILELEQRLSFNFFWYEVSQTEEGYGLILDNTLEKSVSSIASVGFGLSAIPIAVEHGWISRSDGYQRALKTLETFRDNVEQKNGFFIHFVNMKDGKRAWKSEISVIDTALFLMGALTVGEYFGGDVYSTFEDIYARVNFPWYVESQKNQYYMGYTYEKGFFGNWDGYAEQLIMYILGAASPTHPIDSSLYYSFERKVGKYKDYELIYTYTGSLFTYQFSHAWIDFRNIADKDGVNWFHNSVKATLANWEFCKEMHCKFKTLHEHSWGLTACDSPQGYRGDFGAPPSANNNTQHKTDGTVPPCGAIGSLVFTPEIVEETVKYYYENVPELWGEYGFKDAYNLDKDWISKMYIGIDKGIEVLMIENYKTGLIWDIVMKNKYVQKGLELIGFKRAEC